MYVPYLLSFSHVFAPTSSKHYGSRVSLKLVMSTVQLFASVAIVDYVGRTNPLVAATRVRCIFLGSAKSSQSYRNHIRYDLMPIHASSDCNIQDIPESLTLYENVYMFSFQSSNCFFVFLEIYMNLKPPNAIYSCQLSLAPLGRYRQCKFDLIKYQQKLPEASFICMFWSTFIQGFFSSHIVYGFSMQMYRCRNS